MLDLSGPKLYNGCKGLVLFYQITGHLNWLDRPLLVSVVYKLAVFLLSSYVIYQHFVVHLYRVNIIDQNYRNPIFILISLLAGASSLVQTGLGMFTNLFNLCPMFKILTTRRLCFVNQEIQSIVGTRMLKFMMVFLIYHCCLMSLMVCKNVDEFVGKFQLHHFLLDSFCIISVSMHLFGMSHFDFYIRSSFGFWLIAMKFNLEHRFTFLHRYQRKQRISERRWADQARDAPFCWLAKSTPSQDRLEVEFNETYKFVTFEEIQRSLNNMDDHLEVWRSVQTGSMVVITLNAFLSNGALLLLGYNLIVNQANYYHGFILLLLSVNYSIIVFFCYIGDSWISYALSSFVQTVEDEYFLQGADESQRAAGPAADDDDDAEPDREQRAAKQHHLSLLIKKKDVLFCREFLHQFENHLATPWSKLTVKTHLHMLRTFVTLIAAQIIFDHEH